MGDLHVLPKKEEEPESILYTVHYKKVGSWKWHALKNVGGDGFAVNGLIRYFILDNGTRIEIPNTHYIFTFSPERMELVERNVKEAEETEKRKEKE